MAIALDQLMIDYVKGIFFKSPDREFSYYGMLQNMPHFYKDHEMVKASIDILLLRETIIYIGIGLEGEDKFKANPDAIKRESEERERKKEKEIIDLKNAKRIYKLFWASQVVGWLAFIVSIILLWLRIAESKGLWPYR